MDLGLLDDPPPPHIPIMCYLPPCLYFQYIYTFQDTNPQLFNRAWSSTLNTYTIRGLGYLSLANNNSITGWAFHPHVQPPTWRTRPLYLYPPEAGLPSYTSRHQVPILVASYDTHGLRWGYTHFPANTREVFSCSLCRPIFLGVSSSTMSSGRCIGLSPPCVVYDSCEHARSSAITPQRWTTLGKHLF
jgi:hypothetical protein